FVTCTTVIYLLSLHDALPISFFGEVQGFIKENAGDEMKPFVAPLAEATGHLQQATMWFMQNALAKPDNAGAGAYDYMHLFGLVALAYMWAHIAKAAIARRAAANGGAAAMEGRLLRAKFFMERIMPETRLRLARITTGAATMMA